MTEYSRMAKGRFTAAASTGYVNLPFQPDYVELFNYTNYAAGAAANKFLKGYWDASLVVSSKNPTWMDCYTAGSAMVGDVIETGGISTFNANLALQYGPKIQVVAIPKASPTVVELASGHGFNVGDTVIFEGLYQSATTGMPQMCGIPFTISAVDSTHITVKWNSNQSAYTALVGSPTGAYVQKVLYPFLYVPQNNVITAITTGATTTVTCTAYHNLVVGQEIAFRIPSLWGTVELNSLPNNLIPGSPIYGVVTSLTDNWTFVCNINSSSYTAYTSNIAVSKVPGLSFPQVVAVGDYNNGGALITATSSLYPSPSYPTSSGGVYTINGPAIQGAFVNNTRQGFYIGAGTGKNNTSVQIMAANDVIEYRAYLHDVQ